VKEEPILFKDLIVIKMLPSNCLRRSSKTKQKTIGPTEIALTQ